MTPADHDTAGAAVPVDDAAADEPVGLDAARRLAASLGPVVSLTGTPDGVVCRSVQQVRRDGPGWRVVPDRRGRLRLNTAALTAPVEPAVRVRDATVLPVSAEPYRTFVLGAARRGWSAVTGRLGDAAWTVALDLVREGLAVLVCDVDETLRLSTPRQWQLTEQGVAAAAAQTAAGTQLRSDTQAQVESSAADLAELAARTHTQEEDSSDGALVPGLGLDESALTSLRAALLTARAASTLEVLLAAARDVVAGVRHDGPRAFSLAHFTHSKEHDDVAARLAGCGVDERVAEALGVLRAARLGVAGDIRILVAAPPAGSSADAAKPAAPDPGWSVTGLAGPTLLRVDTPGLLLDLQCTRVVIVENLQAAEAVDEFRRREQTALAVLYTSGVPGHASTALLADVAAQAAGRHGRVLVCPDADFGGVRIAEAILTALEPPARAVTTVSDIGAWPHRAQPLWPLDSESVRGLTAALPGLAGGLAKACLDRGYRVEQEQAVVAAVRTWLADSDSNADTVALDRSRN